MAGSKGVAVRSFDWYARWAVRNEQLTSSTALRLAAFLLPSAICIGAAVVSGGGVAAMLAELSASWYMGTDGARR